MTEFFNKDMISWVLISACLAFISGQVWNSIRGPQYLMRARGTNIYFLGVMTKIYFRGRSWIYLPILAAPIDRGNTHSSDSLWHDDRWRHYSGQRRG